MRYFLTLAYNGTRFAGWQRQPNAPSVQAALEDALGVLLRQPVAVTGCGRTDTGVHARHYVAHFDAEGNLPERFLAGVNGLLPADIAVYRAAPVAADAHARYDAFSRSYEYHIALRKDPFARETVWFFPQHHRLNLDEVRAAAALFPRFTAFYPFCKTHSGVDSYECRLQRAEWRFMPESNRYVFYVTANRFLRGMVRLMVGACLQAGLGQLGVSEIETALERQTSLRKSLSVPPQGLFLTAVEYPYPF